MDRNEHVRNYLGDYVGFPHPPRFAVLLNGPWGIGKTFFLKQFLRTLSPDVRYVYVSLYGLTSLEEIDDAVFRAIYPVLKHPGVRLAGRALRAAGRYFRVEADVRATDILSKAGVDLYVFDDLERCDIPVNRVLGYLNDLVEHEDRKVIIVANEKEIRDAPNYSRIREKLIGRTLELRSAFDQAWDTFLTAIDDTAARTFLSTRADDLGALYEQSELQNLRILQQAMWDFERLHRVLTDKHRANKQAMETLLRLVFALSFEIKAGRLVEADLHERQIAIVMSHTRTKEDGGSPLPLVAAANRYLNADLDSSVLSDETVIDLLVRGIVDEEKIRAELDASSYFVTDEPAWRTVWYAFERTEEEFNTALAAMERAFASREYAHTGELLHVFGLRLWLSGVGALARTRDEVVAEGKRYVDDLLRERRLEPISERMRSQMSESYGGLGIHERDTPEYQELYTYLQDKRRAAKAQLHPEAAARLLGLLETDTDEFFRSVSLTNGVDNPVYDAPVLAALDPGEFVAALLRLHPAGQRIALTALQARYEQGGLEREFAPERAWATAVREKLLEAARSMSPMGKFRITRTLLSTLDKPLLVIGREQDEH